MVGFYSTQLCFRCINNYITISLYAPCCLHAFLTEDHSAQASRKKPLWTVHMEWLNGSEAHGPGSHQQDIRLDRSSPVVAWSLSDSSFLVQYHWFKSCTACVNSWQLSYEHLIEGGESLNMRNDSTLRCWCMAGALSRGTLVKDKVNELMNQDLYQHWSSPMVPFSTLDIQWETALPQRKEILGFSCSTTQLVQSDLKMSCNVISWCSAVYHERSATFPVH